MATTRFAVEGFMDAENLKHFYRQDEDGGSIWILLLPSSVVVVRLLNDDSFLHIRSYNLAKLDSFGEPQKSNLLRRLLQRNGILAVSHYCADADDEISIEATLPIDDGELTAIQFHRCLQAVVSEMKYFADSAAAMCAAEEPEVALSELMEKLFESSGTSTGQSSCPSADETAEHPLATDDEEGFEVVLTAISGSKFAVVKVMKNLVGRSLLDCKELVEQAPAPIGRWKTRSQAEVAVTQLKAVGASAVIV